MAETYRRRGVDLQIWLQVGDYEVKSMRWPKNDMGKEHGLV